MHAVHCVTLAGQSELYTLHSVLLHSGSSEGGRYYAYVKAFAKSTVSEWAKFEDESVTSADAKEVSSITLYP
jgi:ubiquitin C-terminal hydrolase